MGDYQLRHLADNSVFPAEYDLFLTSSPSNRLNSEFNLLKAGLFRTEYTAKKLTVQPKMPGLFRYIDWLPVQKHVLTTACSVTFQNKEVSDYLSLPNLWFTFTGWSPEHACYSKTGSFKELEAYPTFSRLSNSNQTVVVSSVGNTGRAFAQAAAELDRNVILVIPKNEIGRIWTVQPTGNNVKLLTVSGDYADAIHVSEKICSLPGFISEGGAKNVARRDGMGTVMLNAATTVGRLPDKYFQAVGSGTGGISAWEASLRLIEDGRFGSHLPELHLIQNKPFTPMENAWNSHRRQILDNDLSNSAHSIQSVYASVLTNRSPPYGIIGGVFDAMTECGGNISSVDNNKARQAFQMFEEFENGLDLDPAAAVAFAALIDAVENKTVCSADVIFLNLTGGGYTRIKEDFGHIPIQDFQNVSPDVTIDELKEVLS